ncbi:hypothetical protein PFISCL1PPCAC_11876, partial [Pristionchus fissidentatus]
MDTIKIPYDKGSISLERTRVRILPLRWNGMRMHLTILSNLLILAFLSYTFLIHWGSNLIEQRIIFLFNLAAYIILPLVMMIGDNISPLTNSIVKNRTEKFIILSNKYNYQLKFMRILSFLISSSCVVWLVFLILNLSPDYLRALHFVNDLTIQYPVSNGGFLDQPLADLRCSVPNCMTFPVLVVALVLFITDMMWYLMIVVFDSSDNGNKENGTVNHEDRKGAKGR